MLRRELATRIAQKEAARHVVEIGGNNEGPRVNLYQAADDLPGDGYAWCMSFLQWCFKQTRSPLPYRTASVGMFLANSRERGWVVSTPKRGDLICFNFTADNWPDHIGIITRVLSSTTVETVEGNTSSGSPGSQSDGDGVYPRVRPTSRAVFVRVPGEAPQLVTLWDIYTGKVKRATVKPNKLGRAVRRISKKYNSFRLKRRKVWR